MTCDYFGQCGSCTLYAYDYEAQLAKKLEDNKNLFASLYRGAFDIVRSQSQAFRARAEFRLWHEDDAISYAMNNMSKDGMVLIQSCSIVTEPIAKLMPQVIALVKEKEIDFKLFHVDFLSTTHGETVVSLLYHRKLDASWTQKASQIAKELKIHIIGRSRKQKVVIGQDFVTEVLNVDGKTYKFEHIENSFTQPNAKVNEKMIEWVLDQTKGTEGDLLELYCGAGNFTLPLTQNFEKIVATEISKSSIKAAKNNCELNGIDTITFLRMSSEEFVQAYEKQREFTRLNDISLDDYNLNSIFVDPPRSGLDETTLQLAQNFDTIIYISCNPLTLKRDLETLTATHTIEKMAVFDQFAYTNHLEMGAVLRKESR